MAIQKTVPLPGGGSASYIRFDRFEFWSRDARRAHAVFSIFANAAAAATYDADRLNAPPDVRPLRDGIRAEVEGDDFDECFPDGICSSSGAYTIVKGYPVCMWHRSDGLGGQTLAAWRAGSDRILAGWTDV